MSETMSHLQTFDQRAAECLRVAKALAGQKPDWVTYFREIMGVEGVMRQLFAQPEEIRRFEATPQFAEIQSLLAQLRSVSPGFNEESTRVLTVRLPASLHESLRTEAHAQQVSMNRWCITKLLQIVEQDEVDGQASKGRS